MITEFDVARFVMLAGDDYAWAGVRGASRPASDVRRNLRAWLVQAQSGVCFDCGEALGESAEFCHIVSRGPMHKGWLPGNIGVGHAVCNERQKEAGPVVSVETMARPDVIATEWPPFPVLRRQ